MKLASFSKKVFISSSVSARMFDTGRNYRLQQHHMPKRENKNACRAAAYNGLHLASVPECLQPRAVTLGVTRASSTEVPPKFE
jgi:hypothetical protein